MFVHFCTLLIVIILQKYYFMLIAFQPENIVLKDRSEKKVKLIDFGLAKIIPPGEIVKAIMGTPEFVGKFFIQIIISFLVEWERVGNLCKFSFGRCARF